MLNTKFRKDFTIAIKTFPKTWKFIRENGMLKYFLVPALLALILFGTTGYLIYEFVPNLVYWISDLFGYDDWQFKGSGIIEKVLNFILGLGMIVASGSIFFITYRYIVLIVLSPFLAWIAEKTERIITGKEYSFSTAQFMNDILRGIRMNLRNFIREIPLTLVLLVLGFIPIIGIIAPILIFITSAYYAGFGLIDMYLERQRMSVGESVKVVQSHRGLALGIGAIFNLLLAIPILGVMISPLFSVITATLAVLETEETLLENAKREG